MISLRPPVVPRTPEGLSVRVTGRPSGRVDSEPWQFPATVDQAKAHLRIDGGAEDGHLGELVATATGLAEAYCRRAIAVQTLEISYSAVYGEARLPRPEHVRLVAAFRVDDDGDTLLQEGYDFRTRRDGARLTVLPATRMVIGAGAAAGGDGLRCSVLAGYARLADGASDPALQDSYVCDAPDAVRHAVLVTVAELYENRTEAVVGTVVGRLPRTAETMLSTYRVFD